MGNSNHPNFLKMIIYLSGSKNDFIFGYNPIDNFKAIGCSQRSFVMVKSRVIFKYRNDALQGQFSLHFFLFLIFSFTNNSGGIFDRLEPSDIFVISIGIVVNENANYG